MEQNVVLCGANSYDQKYYLNQEFSALPDAVKQELQIMCVWFTEDIGGILTLEFEPDGTLIMKTTADDMDYYYDDIGAGLKLHQLQRQKRELCQRSRPEGRSCHTFSLHSVTVCACGCNGGYKGFHKDKGYRYKDSTKDSPRA